MGNGPTQDGSQKGFALVSNPSWSSGDRLTPKSVMKGMSVTPNIPTAPGTKVIAPDASSMPQAQSEVPSIPQSPLSILPQEPSDTFGPNTNKPTSNLASQTSASQNPDQTTTQGTNPVSFSNASVIQSTLPQVQSAQSGAPASNATPNIAQSPSQPNPSQKKGLTHDQALAQGLDKTFSFEGPELTNEPNGSVSVWGIGSDPGEPIPKTKDEAKQYFVQKYINNVPARAEILSQLNTPQDINAYTQYVINAPKKVDAFHGNWRGNIGGDEWRNAMLNTQVKHYYNLANSKPQKYGKYLGGWMDRVNESRGWNPQQDNT